jgi:hypothetical protein
MSKHEDPEILSERVRAQLRVGLKEAGTPGPTLASLQSKLRTAVDRHRTADAPPSVIEAIRKARREEG